MVRAYPNLFRSKACYIYATFEQSETILLPYGTRFLFVILLMFCGPIAVRNAVCTLPMPNARLINDIPGDWAE